MYNLYDISEHILWIICVHLEKFATSTKGTMAPRYKIIGLIFDIIAAIVSLLDLATDLIILVTWYQNDRMIFFWISLSILLLAQMSYITIFYYNHGTWDNVCHSIISVIFTIPFAPILSFIFYIVSDKESVLRKILDSKCCLCFNFEWGENYVDTQSSPQQQYLSDKLYKHLGFLLEAMIEGICFSEYPKI